MDFRNSYRGHRGVGFYLASGGHFKRIDGFAKLNCTALAKSSGLRFNSGVFQQSQGGIKYRDIACRQCGYMKCCSDNRKMVSPWWEGWGECHPHARRIGHCFYLGSIATASL